MAYDAKVCFRQGSLRRVLGDIDAGVGNTATLQSGGTFTLYDSAGGVVPGFDAVAVSGYNATALQEPQIWYVLNTASLTPGVYLGIFTFGAVGSDGGSDTFDVDIEITILAPVEVEATYVEAALLTSALYQARLHGSDADMANAIFSDAEWTYFLQDAGQSPELAAALALDALAVDEAKLSNAVKIGSFGNGKEATYKAIAERAANLRAIAPVSPVVTPTREVFTLGVSPDCPGRPYGSMDVW